MAKLQITYTKSAIGYSKDQKATIVSLGLHKLNSTVVHDDTPSIRGMAFKVRHLVKLTEIAEEQPAKQPAAPKATVVKAAPARAETQTPAPQAEPTARRKAAVSSPAKADAPAKAESAASAKAKSHAPDDLVAIEGIGPKIAGILKAAGIATFADLAATDTSRLSDILHGANLRLADPTTWPEQAQLAAEGKWEEFKALQNSLKGGRRE
jgi:large subunit ribosomal protein L21